MKRRSESLSLPATHVIEAGAGPTKRAKTTADPWVVLGLVLSFVRALKEAVAAKWVVTLRLKRPTSKDRSFASHPKAQFWNHRLNHWIGPRMVAKQCNKKFWFDCTDCGHTILSGLNEIVRGSWCPYCSVPVKQLCGNAQCKSCHTKSFASHPRSANWATVNAINPKEAALFTRKKYWFNCGQCEHSFEASLSDVSTGTWCPYCVARKLCSDDRCTLCHKNSFASHPRASQWSTSNMCRPRDVARSSATKYAFDCDACGHAFSATLNSLSGGSWCPYCVARKMCSDEDCTFCHNNSFASHPRHAQWSATNSCRPRDVSKSNSSQKHAFDCDSCGHTFSSNLNNIVNGQWCPFCASKKMCADDGCTFCLERSFASHPRHTQWSDKNSCRPRDVARSTATKYAFDCDACGHTFSAALSRITSGSWCPYCAVQKLCGDNKCTFCFRNSFASHPRHVDWSTKNTCHPRSASKSSGRKFAFDCDSCGHTFETQLYNVGGGRGCPLCKHKSEKKCREFLCSVFGNSDVNSGRVNWCVNADTGYKLPFDMIIQSKRTICEVDGRQHLQPVPFFNKTMSFKEIWARDRFKEARAIANGYSVIRVRVADIYHDKNEWKQRLLAAIESVAILHPTVVKLY